MTSGEAVGGVAWLILVVGGLVAAIGIALAVTSSRRRRAAQDEQERLATRADETHESAQTRHEGGA